MPELARPETPEFKMPPAKAAHVNMMTDTIIANIPASGLRQVLRGILGGDANLTSKFHSLVSTYLANTIPSESQLLFTVLNGTPISTPALGILQSRYRCLMGCGYGFDSMEALSEVIKQVGILDWDEHAPEADAFLDILASVDGDIVQSVTAVQKELTTPSGMREMSPTDLEKFKRLQKALYTCGEQSIEKFHEFPFERGLSRLSKLVGRPNKPVEKSNGKSVLSNGTKITMTSIESVKLGPVEVPRLFMGLWQFSSPAWGTASKSKIDRDFKKHVNVGLVAYDMADHYGDAEVIFGEFRNSQSDAERMYCATKWAVFEPIKITLGVVDANIKERLTALSADKIELLQFHWQDYNDPQYIQACQLIAAHPSVQSLGLCNFDTEHMEAIVESGIPIVSNQVQFSFIDARPIFAMGPSCLKHNIKLLTYGSLCGGFLANKWLGKQAPSLFDEDMTPSHRKYFEMINIWGGWGLFQELLNILAQIGKRHNVSISSVAVRWVLDHEFVGAVIIGARMGISEHVEENLKVFSFALSELDRGLIDAVLKNSRAREGFEVMGDCGSEYRCC